MKKSIKNVATYGITFAILGLIVILLGPSFKFIYLPIGALIGFVFGSLLGCFAVMFIRNKYELEEILKKKLKFDELDILIFLVSISFFVIVLKSIFTNNLIIDIIALYLGWFFGRIFRKLIRKAKNQGETK